MAFPELAKSPIDPMYSQDQPNQPIALGTHNVRFKCKDEKYEEEATITMRFSPDKRMLIVIPQSERTGMLPLKLLCKEYREGIGKLDFPDRHIVLDVIYVGCGGDIEGIGFIPRLSPTTISRASGSISNVVFHLFNFPEIYGPDDYVLPFGEPPTGSKACGRVVLKGDGWLVTIIANEKTDELCKALSRQGGYAITHVGKIEREDGSKFSNKQASTLLACLRHFLSFALGRWTGPAFPVGFNRKGKRVFEEWGLPWAAAGSWNGSSSWFDRQHGELLTEVFPGFLGLWNKDIWKGGLSHTLYWYLGACDRGTGIGVDTGVVLAQTALELLAWNYCALSRNLILPEAFERMRASDQLRLLASSLDLPLAIPANLKGLNNKIGDKWKDSLDAITSVRNTVVHPNVKNKKLPDGAYYDAWRLSLWYIDMVLLRLCGHNGKYANRMHQDRYVGEIEQVPWTKL